MHARSRTPDKSEGRVNRYPGRENAIGLYLKDHLSEGKIHVSEVRSTRAIVFCIEDDHRRPQHRLEIRANVMADHDAQELEDILDAQCVIERLRAAGPKVVVVSSGDDSGPAL